MCVGIGVAYLRMMGNARAPTSGISNEDMIPALFLYVLVTVLISADVGSPLASKCRKKHQTKYK